VLYSLLAVPPLYRPAVGLRFCCLGEGRTDLRKLEKGASYPGLEIIAKLATVLEVEPAELIRLPKPQSIRRAPIGH
jgi:transcriptional regulator with XRE-family HTH domain